MNRIIYQVKYYFLMAAALPLLPLLAVMGKRVRKSVPVLPEAMENRSFRIPGTVREINLLCLGESTIAGVGVTDQRDGVSGKMGEAINQITGQGVAWEILARNGYTAKMVREKLVRNIPVKDYDLILIGLGGNDTFKFKSPLHFRKNMAELLKSLIAKYPGAKIVIANMPPVGDFPAFPPLVKFFLGRLVRLHGGVICDLPEKYKQVAYLHEPEFIEAVKSGKSGQLTIDDLFSDGVHPSALTYAMWGRELAQFAISKGAV